MARHLQRANSYFEAREYDKAEIEYLNVLAVSPRHPLANYRIGKIYYEEGKLNYAHNFLTKAKQVQPDNLEVRLALGYCFFYARMLKEAREEADFVLSKEPTNQEGILLLADTASSQAEIEQTRQRIESLRPNADKAAVQLALGTLAFRKKDMNAAEAAFKQALTANPQSSAAYLGLGKIYWERKEMKLAGEAFKTAADLSPGNANFRLQDADFNIQTGQMEPARRLLEQLTKTAPYFLPAWNRLAELNLGDKKFDQCAACLKRVLQRDTVNYDGLMLNGRMKLAQHEPAKALIEFERLEKHYPKNSKVQFQLGVALLLNNQPIKAVAHLTQAIDLQPDYPEAILLVSEINIKQGDTASAIGRLRDLIQQHPKLAPAYLLLAKAHMFQARVSQAAQSQAQRQVEQALAAYQGLAAAFPQDPEGPFLVGRILLELKRYSEARQAFAQSLAVSPNYLSALEQLINLDIFEKQYPAALEKIQTRMAQSPKSADLQYLLASIYYAQTNYVQAEAALRKTIELDVSYRMAYLLLARIYVNSNKQQQALENLEKVVAQNPKDISALMQMGVIYNELKNYGAARDSYEKLLAANNSFGPALNNLAYLYCERLGQVDRAYELARRACDVLPPETSNLSNDALARATTTDTLGWVLFKRGDYDSALALLQESAEKLPREPEVLFHLGMVHYFLGSESLAKGDLQRAIEMGPDFPGKQEAQTRLALLNMDVSTAAPQIRIELDKRLAEYPDDPILLSRLAALQLRDKGYAQAAANYEKALQKSPKNAQFLAILIGLYADHLGDVNKALELAKRAHDLLPEDGPICHLLGRLAYQTGDYIWAASLLQQSASISPQNPEARYLLAYSQFNLGRLKEATLEMQNAVQLRADFAQKADAQRFLSLAPLFVSPDLARQSAAQVEKILSADPNYAPALWVAVLIREQQQNFQEAQQFCEKILARYPSFAPANKHLAALYLEQPKATEKAYACALKAREAFPQDPQVAKMLGILVYRKGDFTKSLQLLNESVQRQTADPESFYYLGMAYYRLKQKTESKEALRHALTLNLSPRFAGEAKRVLTEIQ